MHFISKRFSFTAFDGKAILFAELDYPDESGGIEFEYFNRLYFHWHTFVSTKLIQRISDLYFIENKRNDFQRYYFNMNVNESYNTGVISSYYTFVTLKSGKVLINNIIDSVVFYKEYIVPPRIINRLSKIKHQNIILDSNGNPARIYCTDEKVVCEQIKGHKFNIT